MSDSFGQWLRLRRRNRGLSQQEVADQIGCSSALIRKVEANERRPSRQIALLLIDHLRQPDEQPEILLRMARARLLHDENDFGLPDTSLLPLSPLTSRECEILRLIAADLPDR